HLVQGEEKQQVPRLPGAKTSAVTWRLRAEDVTSRYRVAVQSSTGLTLARALSITRPEGPGGKDRILGKDLGQVAGVAFSAAGDRAAAACGDHTVRVWEVASGREVALLAGHDRPVRSVAFAPDGHHLVSAGLDGKLLLWDLKAKSIKRPFE